LTKSCFKVWFTFNILAFDTVIKLISFLHQRAKTLNSLTLKTETHNAVKCLAANYSDQIRGTTCRN